MHDEIKTIKLNKEIEQKYHKIGQRIPQYDNPTVLFEGLLTQMAEEFAIPYIWLTFADREELADLNALLEKSAMLKDRLKILGTSPFLELLGNGSTSLLVNEDLRPYYRLLPINVKYLIRSLAIAPIRINDQLIGCFNCGDASRLRYQPGMDTALLDQLAGQVSEHLAAILGFGKAVSPSPEDAQETHSV
jgi:GAF domain-containing protein